METGGIDTTKLLELQAFFDNHFEEIKRQFEKQVSIFGEKLRMNFGITPDAQEFCNWLADNYSYEILKKRRSPFVLKNDYIIEFCMGYSEELDNKILKQKHDLVFDNINIDNQPHKDDILKIFQELFQTEIAKELFDEILEETSFILHNETIQNAYEKVPRRTINLKQDSLKYAFHSIYSLKKEPKIKTLLTEYLHLKFETFDNSEIKTTRTKFSPKKPDIYPR